VTASAAAIPARGVHHVGIVVADLDAGIDHYCNVLGATIELRRELPDQGVDAASLHVGGGLVELIAPLDVASDNGVARFLAKRGQGVHHVAYEVDDVAASLEALRAAGVALIDEQPRVGLHGVPVAFVHPRGMNGVLTELVQTHEGSHDG
jgi:methylmalonyl-CoA epimerase